MNSQLVYKKESSNIYGNFGIQILLSEMGRDITEKEEQVISNCAAEIMSVVMAEQIQRNPEAMAAAGREKAELLALFGKATIFYKEIPNGYCSLWCCKHRPWLHVTTSVGPITLGWRKRVIQISWELGASANELFPGEDVTKGDRMIHAWGLEKAREYILKLVGAEAL